jgi:hypothetical protein
MSIKDAGAFVNNLVRGRGFGNARASSKVVGKAVGKTDPNKLKHIFGKPRHNLDNLIKVYGSEQEAFNAIEKATRKVIKHKNISGVFEVNIKIGNDVIIVRGNAMNDVIKIGTVFK